MKELGKTKRDGLRAIPFSLEIEMTRYQDVHSIRARGIRAHLRVFAQQFARGEWPSDNQVRRFLLPDQIVEWRAAVDRHEKVRLEQQDARFLSKEAGLTILHNVTQDGLLLRREWLDLESSEAKLRTFKSTNASRIRVFERRAKLWRAAQNNRAVALRREIELFTDDHWTFVKPDDVFDWLVHWRSDQEVAHIPPEILFAEIIQLFHGWISEWDEKIAGYESLENPTIK
ncbi:hypothetical protein [Agrobacterium rosae]|uniref:hypothetical protein n=1 Tax=Agrobacterium rosae TaxID=1972867 RepID=UPI000CD7FB91|nr:hypothetical protein [Agrobacterium rosae]POO56260.1 hypothetical protein CTT39_05865 [Agrobacterium rosae]